MTFLFLKNNDEDNDDARIDDGIGIENSVIQVYLSVYPPVCLLLLLSSSLLLLLLLLLLILLSLTFLFLKNNDEDGIGTDAWLLVCLSPESADARIVLPDNTLNPTFRDFFRIQKVKEEKKVNSVFTWNLKRFVDKDFHFDGPISVRTLQKSRVCVKSKLMACSLDYFVVDFVHSPTAYLDNLMSGAIDVIFWLQKNKILTEKTKIEFKNLRQEHINSKYRSKLQELNRVFSFSSMNFLKSTWGKITQEYYDLLRTEGFDGTVFSDVFKDCLKGREVVQYQLKTKLHSSSSSRSSSGSSCSSSSSSSSSSGDKVDDKNAKKSPIDKAYKATSDDKEEDDEDDDDEEEDDEDEVCLCLS